MDRPLYVTAYGAIEKTTDFKFHRFSFDLTSEHNQYGYWRFGNHGVDDHAAYDLGFKNPEAVLKAVARDAGPLNSIKLCWIPGKLDKFQSILSGSPAQHLRCIGEERKLFGLPASLRDEAPVYHTDIKGTLLEHRKRRYGILEGRNAPPPKAAAPPPNLEITHSTISNQFPHISDVVPSRQVKGADLKSSAYYSGGQAISTQNQPSPTGAGYTHALQAPILSQPPVGSSRYDSTLHNRQSNEVEKALRASSGYNSSKKSEQQPGTPQQLELPLPRPLGTSGNSMALAAVNPTGQGDQSPNPSGRHHRNASTLHMTPEEILRLHETVSTCHRSLYAVDPTPLRPRSQFAVPSYQAGQSTVRRPKATVDSGTQLESGAPKLRSGEYRQRCLEKTSSHPNIEVPRGLYDSDRGTVPSSAMVHDSHQKVQPSPTPDSHDGIGWNGQHASPLEPIERQAHDTTVSTSANGPSLKHKGPKQHNELGERMGQMQQALPLGLEDLRNEPDQAYLPTQISQAPRNLAVLPRESKEPPAVPQTKKVDNKIDQGFEIPLEVPEIRTRYDLNDPFVTDLLPLSEEVPCMDCGQTKVHSYDCNIANIQPMQDPTPQQLKEIVNLVEQFDPEPWRTHRNPPPALEAEDFETKCKGIAEWIRNDEEVKNDPIYRDLPDHALIMLWGLKASAGTDVQVQWPNGDITGSGYEHLFWNEESDDNDHDHDEHMTGIEVQENEDVGDDVEITGQEQ